MPGWACIIRAPAPPALTLAQGGFDPNKLFFGAGISRNDASGLDDATGFQIFGGHEFGPVAQNISVDAEAGHMDSGDMERCVTVPFLGRECRGGNATGLWATGVGRLALNPQFDLIGRLGFDFGDDDGLMFGAGGGYNVNKQMQLRL